MYDTFEMEYIAGWSSLVARQAHNLKVLGSNPSPATNFNEFIKKINFFLFLNLINRFKRNIYSLKIF